ncbi:MAG TPA: helix-turn-helix transcriptional regulator [Rickettsiales bacterium]|nr:helix-turn-helix transcriptional regulator [Rickettsiales bacterium]
MPHPVDVHVGKQLRMRRVILGLSQETIGKAIGVTFQQVQKYERGINRMGASRLYEFAKYLTTPVSYFFEGLDIPQQAAGGAEESGALEHDKMASRETLEMMRAYYRISDPNVRSRVFELVKSLAEGKPVQ